MFLRRGVPRPSAGPAVRGAAGGARNRVPHRRGRDADLGLPFLGYVPPGAWGVGPAGLAGSFRGMRSERGSRGHGAGATTRAPARGPVKGLPPRHLAEPQRRISRRRARHHRARGHVRSDLQFEQAVRGVFSGLDPGARSDGDGRVIAVAPCKQGEDSAPSRSNWRGSPIHAGRRCLLVDGDFGAAELSTPPGTDRRRGRCDVLDGTPAVWRPPWRGDGGWTSTSCPSGQSAEAAPRHRLSRGVRGTDRRSADGYDDVVIAPAAASGHAGGARAPAPGRWHRPRGGLGATPRQLVTPIVARTRGCGARARASC
jgi:hypothetical protein